MKQTPMQELIYEMEKSPLMFNSALSIIKILKSEEKEKQVIESAWINGKENKTFGYSVKTDAEQYYNETFKQK